jgi:succinoglycan biosynthesis protein ExoM
MPTPPLQTPPDAMTNAMSHISVCVCTYKRPQLLKRLFEELAGQETNGRFTYSIVVADNDQSRSAEAVVSQFAVSSTVPVRYCVEPQQNIALARNRAVENAEGDYVAFIDDDEFPTRNWLLTLFEACNKYGVDGVLGPVQRHFDEEPPKWLTKSAFYERPTYPTGYILGWREGRSGNILLKREMFATETQAFDPQFRTGEDQDFLRRMMDQGRVFIWCNEAPVYEVVPSIRWRRSFMLKRALLRGAMEPRLATFGMRDILKSAIAVPIYVVALPFAFVLGQARFMTLLVKLFDHLGKLLAFVGIDPVREQYVTD